MHLTPNPLWQIRWYHLRPLQKENVTYRSLVHPHFNHKLFGQLNIQSDSRLCSLMQTHYWSNQNVWYFFLPHCPSQHFLVLCQKLSLHPQNTYTTFFPLAWLSSCLLLKTNTASIVPFSGIKPNSISSTDTILWSLFSTPFPSPSNHAQEASQLYSSCSPRCHPYPGRLEPQYIEPIQLTFHLLKTIITDLNGNNRLGTIIKSKQHVHISAVGRKYNLLYKYNLL